MAARSAAAELGRVGIVEALELLLLIGEQEPGKFDRAAVRWQARYCRQMADVTQAQAALGLLLMLGGPRRRPQRGHSGSSSTGVAFERAEPVLMTGHG